MFATDHTFQSRHCYPKLVCGDRGGVFTHCLRCPHCTLTTTRMYVAFYTFCIRQRSVFFMLHCSMLTAVQFLSLIEFSGLKKTQGWSKNSHAWLWPIFWAAPWPTGARGWLVYDNIVNHVVYVMVFFASKRSSSIRERATVSTAVWIYCLHCTTVSVVASLQS